MTDADEIDDASVPLSTIPGCFGSGDAAYVADEADAQCLCLYDNNDTDVFVLRSEANILQSLIDGLCVHSVG